MATIECSISGLSIACDHLPIKVPKSLGYYHPVFKLSLKDLYPLYQKYLANELTHTDSYLLFLAYLNATGSINWKASCSLAPNSEITQRLVALYLEPVIRIIDATLAITSADFSQPQLVITKSTSSLASVPQWIRAWQVNIKSFKDGYANESLLASEKKLENKLTYLLKSGVKPENMGSALAEWACLASSFPAEKVTSWKLLIRTSYNSVKMFNTSVDEIKALEEHCRCNLELGTIQSHLLMSTLKEALKRNTEYLGVSDLQVDLGSLDDIILSYDEANAEGEQDLVKLSSPELNRNEANNRILALKARLRAKLKAKRGV